MRLRTLLRLLKSEASGSEPVEQDLDPAIEAVEQSKLALVEAEQHSVEAHAIGARAQKIGQRNGFGQLAEKLLIEREREHRRQVGGHGKPA